MFYNNTAHSISGVGAVIFKYAGQQSQSECLEGSYFTAYKCQSSGAATYPTGTKSAIFSNMILIDNIIGAVVNVGQEGDNLFASIKDSKFYGETDARDCPMQNYCLLSGNSNDKICDERTALVISYFSTGGKPPVIKMITDLPYHKVKSDASWGGRTYYENLYFSSYTSELTFCGSNQKLFRLNDAGADYHPRAKFFNTKFDNID